MLNIQKHNIVTDWLSKKGWTLFSHQKEVIHFVNKSHYQYLSEIINQITYFKIK